MTKLSVNLNKVALLRNQRDSGHPDLKEHARLILENGAHGITAHPRPDQRHIRKTDIPMLADFITNWPNQNIEFNIEGYPSDDFMELVTKNTCHQVTLVPDTPDQRTSDHGWDVKTYKGKLTDIISDLKKAGRRVSVFIDPVPDLIEAAAEVGANRIELYTGPYAEKRTPLETYAKCAQIAKNSGMGINAGHDLSLDNLARFIAAIPDCDEVSIGHAITDDALKIGWPAAVQAYLTAIQYGYKIRPAAAPESNNAKAS